MKQQKRKLTMAKKTVLVIKQAFSTNIAGGKTSGHPGCAPGSTYPGCSNLAGR